MTNLLDQAIGCDEGDRAAKIIQHALGIESDDVANYCFPKSWPEDRESVPASSVTGCRPRRGIWPDGEPKYPLPRRLPRV
jgi:hypothetical protein